MDATEPPDQRPAESDIRQTAQKRRLISCLLLFLVTISLYSSVIGDPFLNFDDAAYVTDNPHVRAGLTWNTVVWAFRTTEASDWKPIAWLSHALDCQLFGLNPAGPHTINMLFHAVNVVLLFLILEAATGMAWRSLLVAALFALHPLNVESVAWISERKNVLSMFFFLLALAAYGWYARRPGVGRYLAVTLAFALGLMTKAQVITFPFALLLSDYWPLYRLVQLHAPPEEIGREPALSPARKSSLWKLILEKVPWFALSAASAVITMKVEVPATQANLPLWVRMANAAISYLQYIGKTFWPANLAIIYPHPELAIGLPAGVFSAIIIGGISLGAIIIRRRRPYFVGWFWFLGTLVPMIGLVQISVHSMADRYAYIPLLGIFVIVSWGAADLITRWRIPTAVSAMAAAVALLALGMALHRQLGFWRDNVTLWSHTLAITKGNYTAEDNLATALLAQGRIKEAVPHLRRARFLRPDDAMATLNLATYDQMQGNYKAALDGYSKIPQLTKEPSMVVNARLNSGYAHYSLKQYKEAKNDFEAAVSQRPGNYAAYRGLGLLAQQAGDIPQAIRDYQRSADLQPTPSGYLLLAQALQLGGLPEAARAAQSQAARMAPDLASDIAAVRQLLAK